LIDLLPTGLCTSKTDRAVAVARNPPQAVILPPENAPQQTGAVQVVQRARWMTSEQGGTLSPAAAAMY
jgi:hypothetical protein